MTQFARPVSDITVGSWLPQPLWQQIDEAVASDTDFISSNNNINESVEVTLSSVSTPQAGNVVINYRYAKDASAGNTRTIAVSLYQGATLIATGTTHTPTATTFTAGTFTLTTTQRNNITNWGDLRLRFTAGGTTGGSAGNRRAVSISFAEMQTPDAVAASTFSRPFATTVAISTTTTRTLSTTLAAQTTEVRALAATAAISVETGGGGGYADITFVGLGTPFSYATGVDITPTVPSGIAVGDLLIAFISFRDQPSDMSTVPSGWALIPGDNPQSASTDSKVFSYYKISDGTEGGASLSFQATASGAGLAVVAAYRGVNTTTPFDVNIIGLASPTSGTVTQAIPAMTTLTDKAMQIAMLGGDDEATVADMFAFPASYTERYDGEGGANVFLGFGDVIRPTAGFVAQETITTTTGDFYALQSFALKPAGSAGGATTGTRILAATAAINTTNTRTVSSTAAVRTTLTRSTTSTVSVRATVSRAVATTASISVTGSVTRTLAPTVSVRVTSTRSLASSAALSTINTRSLSSSVSIGNRVGVLDTAANRVVTTTSDPVISVSFVNTSTLSRAVATSIAINTTSIRTLASTAAIRTTTTRIVATTAAIKTTLTRSLASSLAVQASVVRTIGSTATIKTTSTRVLATTVAIGSWTITRTVGTSLAIRTTLTRSLAASTTISTALTRSVATTVAVTMANARTVGSTISISGGAGISLAASIAVRTTTTRTLAATVASSATATRTLSSSAAVYLTFVRSVGSSISIRTTLTRSVASTTSVRTTVTRTVASTVALSGPTVRLLGATAAVKTTLTRSVPTSATIKTINTRTVSSSVSVLIASSRSLTSRIAVKTTTTRSLTTQVAVSTNLVRTLASSLALKTTSTRSVPTTLSLSSIITVVRSVPTTASISTGDSAIIGGLIRTSTELDILVSTVTGTDIVFSGTKTLDLRMVFGVTSTHNDVVLTVIETPPGEVLGMLRESSSDIFAAEKVAGSDSIAILTRTSEDL